MKFPVESEVFERVYQPLLEKHASNDRGCIDIDDWLALQGINIKTVWTYTPALACEIISAIILPDDIEERTQLILSYYI